MPPVPTPTTRWRCALCGNLTRFDVQRSTRAREFVHVSLAGDAVVEDRQVVAETVDRVTCRWCGRADAVELVPRPGQAGAPEPASGPGLSDAGAGSAGPGSSGAGAGSAGPGAGEPAEHPAGS